MPKIYKNISNTAICRLCLSYKRTLSDIFTSDSNSSTAKKIMFCAGMEVSLGDGFPPFICSKCSQTLKIAYKFKLRCEKSMKILKQSIFLLPTSSKAEECSQWSDSDNDCIETLKINPKDPSNIVEDKSQGYTKYKTDQFSAVDGCVKEELIDFSLNNILDDTNDNNLLDNMICNQKTSDKALKKNKKMCKLKNNGFANLRKEKTIKCDLCVKSFSSSAFLNNHIVKIHNNSNSLDPRSELACNKSTQNILNKDTKKFRPYVCSVCGKRFLQLNNLSRHHRSHSGEKPFQCHICNKLFGHVTNLKLHMHVHEPTRNFKCQICPSDFKRSSHLTEHLKTHSSVREFSCNVCGKGFIKSTQLVTHMRVHTGEKPFSCEHCGKSFNDHSNLTTHIRIHTGERPFVCRICNKGYTQKISLLRHERYHVKLEGKKTANNNVKTEECSL